MSFRDAAVLAAAMLVGATWDIAEASETVGDYVARGSSSASNPTLWGWSLPTGAVAGTHVPAGADSSVPAWRVTDASSVPGATNPVYSTTVGDHPAWVDALADGWRLTSYARYLTDPGQGPNMGLAAFVNDREYSMLLNLDGAGRLQAKLHDESSSTFLLPFDAAAANDYHRFELKNVPGTAFVQLLVDGVALNSANHWDGVANAAHPIDSIHFGNSGRAGTALGKMDYHYVLAEVGPLGDLAADFDADDNVDGIDLAAWINGFATRATATQSDGDADGDRDVDGADFLVWQRQVGQSSATVPIPEPSSGAAALVGGLSLAYHGRRRRRLLGQ